MASTDADRDTLTSDADLSELGARRLSITQPLVFTTLNDVLKPHAAPFYKLHDTHRPQLHMQRLALGTTQFIECSLATHAPALDSYNHLFQSLLHISFPLFARSATADAPPPNRPPMGGAEHEAHATQLRPAWSLVPEDPSEVPVDEAPLGPALSLRSGSGLDELLESQRRTAAASLPPQPHQAAAALPDRTLAPSASTDIAHYPYLAMHFAARASNFAYGAAFSATLATRNNVPHHALRLNLFTDAQAVVVEYALRMGSTPSSLNRNICAALRAAVGDQAVEESIALAIAFGGLVGRLHYMLGTDYEPRIAGAAQFLEFAGWSLGPAKVAKPLDPLQEPAFTQHDAHRTNSQRAISGVDPLGGGPSRVVTALKAYRGLTKFDAQIRGDTPLGYPKLGEWLRERVGYAFPVLSQIRQGAARQAIAIALEKALATDTSSFPVRGKWLAAVLFATIVRNNSMAEDLMEVCMEEQSPNTALALSPTTVSCVAKLGKSQWGTAPQPGASDSGVESIRSTTSMAVMLAALDDCSELSMKDKCGLVLVKSSTARWTSSISLDEPALSPDIVVAAQTYMSAQELTDLCFWVSLVQLLHHLYQYAGAGRAQEETELINTEAPVPYMGKLAKQSRIALSADLTGARELGATPAALVFDQRLDSTEVTSHPADIAADVGNDIVPAGQSIRASQKLPTEAYRTENDQSTAAHPETVAAMLKNHRVSFKELKRQYYPMLRLEQMMIGASPNSDTYLAIWPTGLRTAMLIIPNFLNCPQLLLGRKAWASKIGLAMHYSARSAKSRYCSLHTCVFALRRGIPAEVIRSNAFSASQAVVVDTALRMGAFPHTMSREARTMLFRDHTADQVEWIVCKFSYCRNSHAYHSAPRLFAWEKQSRATDSLIRNCYTGASVRTQTDSLSLVSVSQLFIHNLYVSVLVRPCMCRSLCVFLLIRRAVYSGHRHDGIPCKVHGLVRCPARVGVVRSSRRLPRKPRLGTRTSPHCGSSRQVAGVGLSKTGTRRQPLEQHASHAAHASAVYMG